MQKTPGVRSFHLWERGTSSLFSRAPQVEACMGMASTWGDSFVSPCLMTIVLLPFTGPPVFCLVKDHERA